MFVSEAEEKACEGLISDWGGRTGVERFFLALKAYLEGCGSTVLGFHARPGVSYSLRALRDGGPGEKRPLFVMVDVVDDAPEERWLSVCFYGAAIADPEERGDLIPGGLLGEDGYCFDVTEDDPELLAYLQTRIAEAHRAGRAA